MPCFFCCDEKQNVKAAGVLQTTKLHSSLLVRHCVDQTTRRYASDGMSTRSLCEPSGSLPSSSVVLRWKLDHPFRLGENSELSFEMATSNRNHVRNLVQIVFLFFFMSIPMLVYCCRQTHEWYSLFWSNCLQACQSARVLDSCRLVLVLYGVQRSVEPQFLFYWIEKRGEFCNMIFVAHSISAMFAAALLRRVISETFRMARSVLLEMNYFYCCWKCIVFHHQCISICFHCTCVIDFHVLWVSRSSWKLQPAKWGILLCLSCGGVAVLRALPCWVRYRLVLYCFLVYFYFL